MKWERGHRSQHVEDLRGQPAKGRGGAGLKIGGGSAVLLIVVALIAKALGVDVPMPSGGGGGTPSPSSQGARSGADGELFDFVNYVVDDIQNLALPTTPRITYNLFS